MNDRFKFRVWLKHSEKMVYIDKKEADDLFSFLENVNDRQIIMQCTGLKDKNGKLIYEGDIVKPLSEYPTFNGEIKFGKIDNHQGFYVDWHTKYPILRGDLYFWLEDKDEGLEVIGNIYHNSHLLEKEKDI